MRNNAVNPNTRTKNNKGNNYLFPLLICVAAGIMVTVLITLLCSIFITKVDSTALVTVFAFLALFIGAFVGGYLTGMAFRKEKIFMGLVSGLVFSLLWVLLNLLFIREPVTILSIIKYAMIILTSVGATFFVKPVKKKRK